MAKPIPIVQYLQPDYANKHWQYIEQQLAIQQCTPRSPHGIPSFPQQSVFRFVPDCIGINSLTSCPPAGVFKKTCSLFRYVRKVCIFVAQLNLFTNI